MPLLPDSPTAPQTFPNQSMAEHTAAAQSGILNALTTHSLSADPELTRYYESYRTDQELLGKIIPVNSPTHQKLNQCLNQTLESLGANPTEFVLHIINEPTVNAFVFPGVVPAPIFVTTGMLQALSERYGDVTKGHLALLFGHESAHVREHAYKPPAPIDVVISSNEVFESRRPPLERVALETLRLIELRAGGRNEEYECDKHGLRAARRLGTTDAEPIEVLKLLAEREAAAKAARDKPSSLSAYAAVLEQVRATHPASQNRVDKGIGHQRYLSIQGEKPQPETRRETSLPANEVEEIAKPTSLQAELKLFTQQLAGTEDRKDALSLIKKACDKSQTLVELQNITLIAGLHLQAIDKSDLSRFVAVSSEKEDASAAAKKAPSIKPLNSDLREFCWRLHQRVNELADRDSSVIEKKVTHAVLVAALSGVWSNKENLATNDPIAVLDAVAEFGRMPFECATLDENWLRFILKSSAGADAEEVIAAGQFDQRALLLSEIILPAIVGPTTSQDQATQISLTLAQNVPDLLKFNAPLRETLLEGLRSARTAIAEQKNTALSLEDFLAIRRSMPPTSETAFCSALPLAALTFRAGREGKIEILQTVASDDSLPAKARSVLGTIFFQGYLEGPAKELSLEQRGNALKELVANTSIAIEPVPFVEQYPTSHSAWRSVALEDPLWKQVLTEMRTNYDLLPVYQQGFSRLLLLISRERPSSEIACPNPQFDPSDPELALIGAFTARLPEAVATKISKEMFKKDTELFRHINYSLAGNKGETLWVDGSDGEISADHKIKDQLCEAASLLLRTYAASVDGNDISPPDLKSAIALLRYRDDITQLPSLAAEAQAEILPLLAAAKPVLGKATHELGSHVVNLEQGKTELESTLSLFSDYYRFVEARLTPRAARSEIQASNIKTPDSTNLESIVFAMGRSLFDLSYRFGTEEMVAAYAAMQPNEKVQVIEKHFVTPSAEKDKHLLEVLKEIAPGSNSFEVKQQIFEALYSTVHATRLGTELFNEEVRRTPQATAAERLELILRYLPIGSSQRDLEVRALYDGRADAPGLVSSWADHKVVQARLKEEAKDKSSNTVIRGSGLEILLDSIKDDRVPATERARVLLWVAGLRESTILVECAELATERRIRDIKKESDLLTSDEKEAILYEALAGSEGILRDKGPGRDVFLNTLFIGVFQPLADNAETLAQCKACFDTMMKLDEPERAARFLATCMVGYLDKLSEPEQVKLLFSSYGALGPKAAQQVLARTTLFRDETREALMDLTSRVPGGSCAELYEAFQRKYGTDAELFVKSIKPAGGGSFQQVWEVTFWNEDRSGDGASLICCKLRPNVIVDIGADLRTTQGLANAMEAAPELFGGAHLNRRAGEVIAKQSALETNYPFIMAQQEGARLQLAETKPGKVRLTIPAIVYSHNYTALDGSSRTANLSNDEFIFMKKAPGQTLDKFLAEHPKDKERVYLELAHYTIHQILTGGYLHCDLHQGNVFVDRAKNGNLTISLIDWGISVKTPQVVSEGMQQILRIAAGAGDEGFNWRSLLQKLSGATKVDEATGVKALGDFIQVLSAAAGKDIAVSRFEELATVLYEKFSDPESSIQDKLQAIEPALAEVGIKMPLAVDYALRGLATLKYVWQELGEKDIWKILKAELKVAERGTSIVELDRKQLSQLFTEVATDCGISAAEIEKAVTRVKNAGERSAQFAAALGELKAFYRAQGEAAGAVSIITKLKNQGNLSARLGAALGVDDVSKLLDEVYAIDRLAENSGTEFQPNLQTTEEVRQWCYDNKIGQVPEIWSAPLHPATIIRASGGGKGTELFVTLYSPSPESPPDCQILALDSIYASEHSSLVTNYVSKALAAAAKREEGEERAIPSVVKGPKARGALFSLMRSFDSELRKIDHLLREPGRTVEYFTGERWRDLRELRLS